MSGMRSLRWRAAISVVGVLFVIYWVVASGGTSYIVQIDYNWARDFLEGSVVEIDGHSVGVLQRYGRSGYVTGFEVEPGDHTVRVVHPNCEGVPEDVTLGPQGTRFAILMADVDDGFRCRVILR